MPWLNSAGILAKVSASSDGASNHNKLSIISTGNTCSIKSTV
jgi:hypothetical protein